MPLLVVPVAPEEVDLLTVGELDRLLACRRVLFERPDHPLMRRLRDRGVACGGLDDEPEATSSGLALVADPASPRVAQLARDGAVVTEGPAEAPDGLTAAWAAPVLRRAGAALSGAVAVIARLRSDDGCPWDREQTHRSLGVHVVEEAHEVVEAIEVGDVDRGLREELGDVLLQVIFHSRMAEQEGRFDIADVAEGLVAKLVARHPHVFSDVVVGGAAEVLANWEAIKVAEKRRADPFEDIPASLPAVLKAYKVQKRAAARGWDAAPGEARARLLRALEGKPTSESVGEAMFWLVAVARVAGIDPESALNGHTHRFRAAHTSR